MEAVRIDLYADFCPDRREVGGLNEPLKTTKIYDDVIVDPLEGDLRNRARELSLFFRHDIDILGANDHIHRLIFLKAAVHAGKFLSIHAYHTVGMHDAVNDVGLPDEIGHECVLGLIVDIGGRANLLDVEIIVSSLAGLDEDKEDADIVLVGPQVRCALASVRERVPERIPVMAVDTRDYGMAKGDRVMQAALDEIRQYKEHKIHME